MSAPFAGELTYTCQTCDAAGSFNTLAAAVRDAARHTTTNGHYPIWTTITFETPLAIVAGAEYELTCLECRNRWRFEARSEAESFAEAHEDHHGHQPDDLTEQAEATLPTRRYRGSR